jgi:hypothetical protein
MTDFVIFSSHEVAHVTPDLDGTREVACPRCGNPLAPAAASQAVEPGLRCDVCRRIWIAPRCTSEGAPRSGRS